MGAYDDLRLLLHPGEDTNVDPDKPIFILCDKWINDKIDEE